MNRHYLKKITSFFAVALCFVQLNTYAMETNFQAHKVNQSGTYGFSVGISDSFFKQKEFNWLVSYNRVQNKTIEWNNDAIDFSLDTVDLMLSYRYSPKSYSTFVKSLTFEFQAGAGIALTENKFNWPELNEERFFSEQGDVNAVVAFVIHKSFSKDFAMQLGVKHYPDYSNFGDISSAFIGFSYNFGSKTGY